MAVESSAKRLGREAPQASGFTRKGMVEEKSPDMKECLQSLERIAPLNGRLLDLLELPQDIYKRPPEGGSSFSSSSEIGIESVPDSMFLRLELPKELPDYGILISSRGSSLFCTLLDKKRRILVSEEVGSLDSPGGGNWTAFQASLEKALSRSQEMRAEGKGFAFAVEAEGSSVI